MTTNDSQIVTINSPGMLANLIDRLPAAGSETERRERILARTICQGMHDKGFGWSDCFLWSDLFTDQELEAGILKQIPETWFETSQTDIMVEIAERFVESWSAVVGGLLQPIKMKHNLASPASKLRAAGVGPGAKLRSTCGGFECVVHAIGKDKALGFWIKWPEGTFKPYDVTGERILALNVADWQIIEFGEG